MHLNYLGLKEFQQDVLKAHNKYRKIHAAKPLKLDTELSKSAMNYAKSLAKTIKKIKHSQLYEGRKTGENLLMSAVPIPGATVVKLW